MARRSSHEARRTRGAVPGALALLAVLLVLPLGEAGAPAPMPVTVDTEAAPGEAGATLVNVSLVSETPEVNAVSYQIGSSVTFAGAVPLPSSAHFKAVTGTGYGRMAVDPGLPTLWREHGADVNMRVPGGTFTVTGPMSSGFVAFDEARMVSGVAAFGGTTPPQRFETFDELLMSPDVAAFGEATARQRVTAFGDDPAPELATAGGVLRMKTCVAVDERSAPMPAPTLSVASPSPRDDVVIGVDGTEPSGRAQLGIQWSATRHVAFGAAHEVFVRETVNAAPHANDQVPAQLFVRVWTQSDASDAIVLPVGESYHPPSPGPTASWHDVVGDLAGQAFTVVTAMAAVCGTVTINAHPKQRDWDFPVPIPWPIAALFTRLRRSKVLDHPKRRTIMALIEANPGIRFYELRDQAELSVGVLSHHLRMMTEHDLIMLRRSGRRVHLYAKGKATAEAGQELSDRQARILALVADGTTTQTAIAKRLGLTQQAVSYQLRQLEQQGVVRRARGKGRTGHYLVVGERASGGSGVHAACGDATSDAAPA